MTVETPSSLITYTGNGATTIFSYSFRIDEADQAVVTLTDITDPSVPIDTVLTGAQYTLTGLGDDAGGTVTYPLVGSPIAATKRITIQRVVEITQETDIVNQGSFNASVLETALDKLTMICQQLDSDIGRAILIPVGSSEGEIDLSAFIAAILAAEASVGDSVADAEAAADAAEASAIAAAASAASIDTSAFIKIDGTRTFTANQPLGGFKLTGLGAATANGDAVRFEQIALAALGLGTANSPEFTGINLGHATNTTLTQSAPGILAVEGVELNANIPVNSKSAAYTTVLADANEAILHPASDNNARTFTIAANASVAYPVGTTLTFINKINTVTIAITSDTLTLAGAGTTGSRTLAANGMATALKITSTEWMISGSGLT